MCQSQLKSTFAINLFDFEIADNCLFIIDNFLFRIILKDSLMSTILDDETMIIKVLRKTKTELPLKRMSSIFSKIVNIYSACEIQINQCNLDFSFVFSNEQKVIDFLSE